MQKIHFHNDFDVHLNFTNIKTDYVSRVEFWTRRDDVFCCCKCDGSLKVENDTNIVCYLNDHNLATGKLNYNVIFQIPDINYADGYKKVCQHYVSDIFLTSENGDTTVAIVKVLGDEEVTHLINRLSEFEKVFDNKQDKLQFDNTPTLGSKNVVYSDGIYNAIKNNKPDLTDYAKKTDLQGLATEQWVDDKGYITSIPDDYVTETELNSKGYLTEHQSLDDYAKKSDIPSVEGLATENWVTNQGYITSIPDDYVTETELDSKGYLTEHQSLADYARKTDLQGLATEQWVNDKGYLTSIPDDYVTESELDNKGYVLEKFDSDNYNSHIDVKNASIFLDSQNWMKYVKLDPQSIKVYDKGTQGQEIYTQLTTNTLGVVKSKDGKTDLAAFLITDEGKGSLRIKDSENDELNISVDGITIKEGFDEYNIPLSKIKDMATENWVTNQGYITSIPDDYAKKTDIPNTSIWTVTVKPSKDTKYSLLSYQYLRIIPADAVKLTFNKSDFTNTNPLMREYHIVIDCNKAVPTAEFKGVVWEIDNDPVFEKGKIYDLVIRDDGINLYGSWKAYKLITILITTSDATDVRLNGTTYNLVAGDNSLTDVDFKTITDIDGFNSNNKITSLDFGGATLKIEDLHKKFSSMGSLGEINNIIVKDATNFNYMFYYCSGLKTLDVSKWDVSSATDFYYMFFSCSDLTSLNVSNFNTSSATGFNGMFAYCRGLTSLDVSGWDTSSATDFGGMFKDCSGLTSLNVSNFNTSSATNFYEMFFGCTNLATLDVSNWNVSKATNFSEMFSGCTNLATLDVSGWNTSSATNFGSMFSGCKSLTSLNVSNFNTSSVYSFNYMFSWCIGLTSLDVSGWDTSSAQQFTAMFNACSFLTSLDLSRWDTSSVSNCSYMFLRCTNLKTLDLSGWNIRPYADVTNMFEDCNALTTIRMVGCSQATIDKINSVKPASATIITE